MSQVSAIDEKTAYDHVELLNGETLTGEWLVSQEHAVIVGYSGHKVTIPWHRVEEVVEVYDDAE